ncbi:hypothetical protein R1T08_01335 [Streptomyces sp. SBC-4]|nr:hypothetical protein [Streptomyces sp. SBC-4]MDV5142998.1 hypothetical protein [Streptomyces sp. SBC-4]
MAASPPEPGSGPAPDDAVPATGSRSPGSSGGSVPSGRGACRGTGRTASRSRPPGASGTAPCPRSLWKEGFQWVASDAANPCSAMVRGASTTRCTGGSARHASPGAVARATVAARSSEAPASAPGDFRARHFPNMPILSTLPSP